MKISKCCCGTCKYYTPSSITLEGLGEQKFLCDNEKAKESYKLAVSYGDSCMRWERREYKLKETPFSWNDNMSGIAQEDFKQIQAELPYGICSSIGTALAKLEILEAQGAKVEEEALNLNGFY